MKRIAAFPYFRFCKGPAALKMLMTMPDGRACELCSANERGGVPSAKRHLRVSIQTHPVIGISYDLPGDCSTLGESSEAAKQQGASAIIAKSTGATGRLTIGFCASENAVGEGSPFHSKWGRDFERYRLTAIRRFQSWCEL